MHTAVFILTALLAATSATRYTNRRLHLFFFQNTKALFGCSRIRINPHVLGWIVVKLELNSTSIHFNTCEFDNIQTRPNWT
jgi:hypothetical protein